MLLRYCYYTKALYLYCSYYRRSNENYVLERKKLDCTYRQSPHLPHSVGILHRHLITIERFSYRLCSFRNGRQHCPPIWSKIIKLRWRGTNSIYNFDRHNKNEGAVCWWMTAQVEALEFYSVRFLWDIIISRWKKPPISFPTLNYDACVLYILFIIVISSNRIGAVKNIFNV
jgi:hypothetical protein